MTVVEAATTLRRDTRKSRHHFHKETNNLYPSNDFIESFPEIKYEVKGRLTPYLLLKYNTYYLKKNSGTSAWILISIFYRKIGK